jgi:heme/copper-type cytochrome/quinol oxidase subunit 3
VFTEDRNGQDTNMQEGASVEEEDESLKRPMGANQSMEVVSCYYLWTGVHGLAVAVVSNIFLMCVLPGLIY